MNQSLYPVVILAGGLATRLRPLTATLPKSLINIQGEPFIAHQLRLLQKNQIKEVILCLGFLGEAVHHYIGDGSQYGLKVRYSFDGDRLLGTAGAIKRALHLLDECFFVLYGDSYLPCDYAAVQQAFHTTQEPALMTVQHNCNQGDSSNVEFENQRIVVYDKIHKTERMQYIDYGLGVFHSRAFDEIPDKQPYDLALLYQQLLKTNQLAGFEIKERFYEVGSFKGIQDLNNYLTLKEQHALY